MHFAVNRKVKMTSEVERTFVRELIDTVSWIMGRPSGPGYEALKLACIKFVERLYAIDKRAVLLLFEPKDAKVGHGKNPAVVFAPPPDILTNAPPSELMDIRIKEINDICSKSQPALFECVLFDEKYHRWVASDEKTIREKRLESMLEHGKAELDGLVKDAVPALESLVKLSETMSHGEQSLTQFVGPSVPALDSSSHFVISSQGLMLPVSSEYLSSPARSTLSSSMAPSPSAV